MTKEEMDKLLKDLKELRERSEALVKKIEGQKDKLAELREELKNNWSPFQ